MATLPQRKKPASGLCEGTTVGATMRDVARLAGVSVKTVSNVVNEYPYVRTTTRARVSAAIDELGYQVNLTARSLRRGRSGLIGLALPELKLPYFAELADAIIVEAEKLGLRVLIEQTNAERARELEALHGERRVLTDGLIYSPLALGRDDLDALAVDSPLVLIGERILDSAHDHVSMRNVGGAAAATRHLLEQGRRRIALVGAHPGDHEGTAVLRQRGYAQALAQSAVPFDPALVRSTTFWHRDTGAAATLDLIDSGVAFDGIFAANDALALGVLFALHSRRVDVPRDVAVIGFDDVEDARFSHPTLSSIDPGRRQIARTAVTLLHGRIEEAAGGADRAPARTVYTDFSLHVRASSVAGG